MSSPAASPRASATAARREGILDAALELFNERGFAATTIADVRERSGASTGSIYHHFGSKEELAAALYVESLAGYQEGVLAALSEHPRAEEGIRAVVRHHVRWMAANPDRARYLLGSRPPEVVLATRLPLRDLNRALFRAVSVWAEPHVTAGRLRPLPPDLFHAIVLGPSQEYGRLWLADRVATGIEDAVEVLSDAAWAAVRAEGDTR